MTALGRNLKRLFLALVYATFALGPQAQAASQKAPTSAKLSAPKAVETASPRPASKAKFQPLPADSAAATASVDPVIVTELRWDGERLVVGTDRAPKFRSFSLREPDRVVVDLFDAELGDPALAQILSIDREPIRQIRIGAHPEGGFLRLVIDCDRPVPIQISQPRGLARLVIRPQELSPEEATPKPQAPEAKTVKAAAAPPSKKAEVFGPPESLRATPASTTTRKATPVRPEPKSVEAKGPEPKSSEAKAGAPKAQDAKVKSAKAPEASPSVAAREEVGVKLTHADGSTQLKLHGARALRLRIQQAVDPPRLVVQIPAGTLKGKLPKAKGQVASLETRDEGEVWVLEARLPEGPLDIQNRLEDDGKTLVLAIQRQVVTTSKRPLVLIDPGHGGDDPGALGAGGTKESEVNLAIALKLQEALQARGVNAVLTRTGDVSLDLASRARMVDQMGAQALVSVHANSHDVTSALGLETYYRTAVSQPFAQQIHQVLVSDLQRPDRGVREARLFVLRHPTIPSALIEAGFISNPEEEVLLADQSYQRKAAEAIAKGVASYLSTPVAELSH